ncbi:mucosal pentraxin-like [Alosa alosa]|uniref:mucosal pentraxin-like n=1 Tax=Alosa alosa TaxID=278164 RepID=UPI002015344F|nr:mucosal pentraxin-like [Alosa alosa]
MKKLELVFLTVTLCSVATTDLSGKVFSFPQQGSTAHVRLAPLVSKILFSTTVCLRFRTDIDNFVLFSMDTPAQTNSYAFFRIEGQVYHFWASGSMDDFYGLPNNLNKWNSICATWDAGTGMAQLIINEIHSLKKTISAGGSISGPPIIILGQDQDSYGGGFDASQSFIEQIRDVHMWDHVISTCEIKSYMQGFVHRPGNYLNWARMDFSIHECAGRGF